jgi:hypothetical protein
MLESPCGLIVTPFGEEIKQHIWHIAKCTLGHSGGIIATWVAHGDVQDWPLGGIMDEKRGLAKKRTLSFLKAYGHSIKNSIIIADITKFSNNCYIYIKYN